MHSILLVYSLHDSICIFSGPEMNSTNERNILYSFTQNYSTPSKCKTVWWLHSQRKFTACSSDYENVNFTA